MNPEEIRLRSLYMYFTCLQAVEAFKDRLSDLLKQAGIPPSRAAEYSIVRELGILFRYWASRHVWELLQDREADAKTLNVALLRLFIESFKLPRDGSGLQYAQVADLGEVAKALIQRLSETLQVDQELLIGEVTAGIVRWHDAILAYTQEAVALPLERIREAVAEWLKTMDLPREGFGLFPESA